MAAAPGACRCCRVDFWEHFGFQRRRVALETENVQKRSAFVRPLIGENASEQLRLEQNCPHQCVKVGKLMGNSNAVARINESQMPLGRKRGATFAWMS